MKFLHLSDLHLGKRLHEASLIEDQACILDQILSIAKQETPHAVLIAGDIYDKSMPTEEAVRLLNGFLSSLQELGIPVLLISGNHDSQERLGFGAQLMRASGVHVVGVYDPAAEPVTLMDEYGPVDVHLLPFVKAVHVRQHFPEENIRSVQDAVACALRHLPLREGRRRVLVAHLFVIGGKPGGSEDFLLDALAVGGTDQVDSSLFGDFDYVALGHLHNPHHMGQPHIRYCGTPLKYSFDEARFGKSVTIAELDGEGRVSVTALPLHPLRDMQDLTGTFEALTSPDFLAGIDPEAYTRITLTDEEDVPNAGSRLHFHYPRLLSIRMDNRRTRAEALLSPASAPSQRTPQALIEEFFRLQNGTDFSEAQNAYILQLLEELREAQA